MYSMSSIDQAAAQQAQALSDWYERVLRSFLERHLPQQLAQLDDEHERLKRTIGRGKETRVCFIGGAGIGKSTLLNAIVARDKVIVPAGGVGPLTALATEVRYSATPQLRVQYHPRGHLRRVASALNFHVKRARKAIDAPAAQQDQEAGLDDENITGNPESEGASRRMDELIRTVRLLVTGDLQKQLPVDYLADALSVACSLKPRWGTSVSEEDSARIARIQQALQMAERGEDLNEEAGSGFRLQLREHAAGFLSPLVKRIEVGWPSEALLGGLVLVDLPGVGVAGDIYQQETQRFVRETARAVVLVVGKSGLTVDIMDLLRSTGYWDRAVLGSDDPDADPCSLLIAVTHVDDVTNEEWFGQPVDEESHCGRSKREVFEGVQDRLKGVLSKQLEQQLVSFVHTEGSSAIREARESAARHLLQTVEVHPVSAIEYRRLIAENEDDTAFLKSEEQSGMPGLTRALVSLATRSADARLSVVTSLTRRLAESLCGQLETIERGCRSDTENAEAGRIRAILQGVLEEMNRRYDIRRASFRTFLSQTVPEKVQVAVHEAKEEARRSIDKYLDGLQEAPWQTLRAALKKGGSFRGARYINLPADIALRFQDPVAASWSQNVLKTIRGETYSMADDTRRLVEELCDWVTREGTPHADSQVTQIQKEQAAAQAARLQDVGKEAIQGLREVVKREVQQAIEGPIRERCQQFIQQGNHVGRDVRRRILGMFRTLAMDASEVACSSAFKTLMERYEHVNAEIQRGFEAWGSPLDSAAAAIAKPYEDRVKSGEEQRRKLLAEIDGIRAKGRRLIEAVAKCSMSSDQEIS
jgi:hypothetical protein